MSARRVAVQLLTVVVVFACASDLPLGPEEAARSPYGERSENDGCAIMVAALDSFAVQVSASSLTLVDSTMPFAIEPIPEYAAGYRRALVDSLGLDPAVWNDFVQLNKRSVSLCRGIADSLAVHATLATSLNGTDGDSLHPPGGLPHGKWPNIVLHYAVFVSRAAVNDDGSQALIEVSGSCGPLCGSGWMIVLERVDDRWRVRGMLMT